MKAFSDDVLILLGDFKTAAISFLFSHRLVLGKVGHYDSFLLHRIHVHIRHQLVRVWNYDSIIFTTRLSFI